jgi:hypothetical protein
MMIYTTNSLFLCRFGCGQFWALLLLLGLLIPA